MADTKKVKSEGPHPMDRHVGMRVRQRRMMLGLSQDKLGEALGLTFQQVQKYEKGVNRVGASRLYEISKILSVPIQFFYDGFVQNQEMLRGFAEEGGKAGEPVDFTELLSTPEGLQLCRAFINIKDVKVRRRVIDLIRSLSESDDNN